jgi:hypothetical protein
MFDYLKNVCFEKMIIHRRELELCLENCDFPFEARPSTAWLSLVYIPCFFFHDFSECCFDHDRVLEACSWLDACTYSQACTVAFDPFSTYIFDYDLT